MLRLLTMGGLSLADERGHEVRRVLRRPKWVAFLCVLATSRGWVSRESLLALLWPELDEPHARHALRQTLSELKATLPAGTLRSEAGAGLMADPDELWSDAADLQQAARDLEHQRVRDLYGGEYLPGFDGAARSRSFEDWLDRQRNELRRHARRSTWALAMQAEADGRTVDAVELAVDAARLEPYDEAVLRRSLLLLARVGDRGRACDLFETFRRRFETDLEMEPSGPSRDLMDRIRAGAPLGG
ncbi:MAG TPA: BTAD domain-containing putative transcriptional regulator [Longimicrobiales bacterium]|nr:BTAD domain-containing putative transcriptional regulator [Longimicrobiales bacterium]